MSRLILDLFAGTGSATNNYAAAGYDRRKITLPDYDIHNYKPPSNVYGIWASPPCNEWSLAKGSQPRDFKAAWKEINATLQIIWSCWDNGSLAWWCLENPRGFLRQKLGKPTLMIHCWEFGDIIDKPTDLWGYFNFPKKRYTEPPGLLLQIRNMPNDKGFTRSITPPCFAQAFYQANP